MNWRQHQRRSERYSANLAAMEAAEKPLWETSDWQQRLKDFRFSIILDCLASIPEGDFTKAVEHAIRRDAQEQARKVAEREQSKTAESVPA